MVWTACVAVYFSFARTISPDSWDQEGAARMVFRLIYGVGFGTALGGLLLWVARRRRGLPFPSQPGETLLVLLSVGALVNLSQSSIFSLVATLEELDASYNAWWWRNTLFNITMFLRTLFLGVLYLSAAVRTDVTRWRLYLTLVVVSSLVSYTVFLGQSFFGLYGLTTVQIIQGIYLLPRAVLLVVVIRDVLQPAGYRWTHWLGAGIDLWLAASTAGWLVWTILFPEGY